MRPWEKKKAARDLVRRRPADGGAPSLPTMAQRKTHTMRF
jgi:hypothetical protein